jgi:hypothetical protein
MEADLQASYRSQQQARSEHERRKERDPLVFNNIVSEIYNGDTDVDDITKRMNEELNEQRIDGQQYAGLANMIRARNTSFYNDPRVRAILDGHLGAIGNQFRSLSDPETQFQIFGDTIGNSILFQMEQQYQNIRTKFISEALQEYNRIIKDPDVAAPEGIERWLTEAAPQLRKQSSAVWTSVMADVKNKVARRDDGVGIMPQNVFDFFSRWKTRAGFEDDLKRGYIDALFREASQEDYDEELFNQWAANYLATLPKANP